MYMRIPVNNRRDHDANTATPGGKILYGTVLPLEADRPVATVACSLEARRHRLRGLPLRGFFVAQEAGYGLGLGMYRLRLEDGQEEIVSIDHLTPLSSQAKHLGSFEIVKTL